MSESLDLSPVNEMLNKVADKAPEVAEQIVNWAIICDSIILTFSFIIITTAVFVVRFCSKKLKEAKYGADEDACIFGMGVSLAFIAIFSLVAIPLATFDLCKVIVAPDLYVVEYLIQEAK